MCWPKKPAKEDLRQYRLLRRIKEVAAKLLRCCVRGDLRDLTSQYIKSAIAVSNGLQEDGGLSRHRQAPKAARGAMKQRAYQLQHISSLQGWQRFDQFGSDALEYGRRLQRQTNPVLIFIIKELDVVRSSQSTPKPHASDAKLITICRFRACELVWVADSGRVHTICEPPALESMNHEVILEVLYVIQSQTLRNSRCSAATFSRRDFSHSKHRELLHAAGWPPSSRCKTGCLLQLSATRSRLRAR
jgi:hypothetical protein